LNVPINGSINLGNVYLNPGFLLSGTVLNPQSQPLAGAVITVENVLGPLTIYVSNHITASTGTFQVAVPAGTYRVKTAPPSTLTFASAVTGPIAVSGSTAVPTIMLQTGYVLSGTIFGWNGAAEGSARLDVLDSVTGAERYTPNNITAASGTYSIVVPTGTWNVRILCNHLSLSQNALVTGVVVSSATTLNHALSLTPAANYLVATNGVSTIPNGSPLSFDAALYNPGFVSQQLHALAFGLQSRGTETILIPPFPSRCNPSASSLRPGCRSFRHSAIPAHLGFPHRLRFTVMDAGRGP